MLLIDSTLRRKLIKERNFVRRFDLQRYSSKIQTCNIYSNSTNEQKNEGGDTVVESKGRFRSKSTQTSSQSVRIVPTTKIHQQNVTRAEGRRQKGNRNGDTNIHTYMRKIKQSRNNFHREKQQHGRLTPSDEINQCI